MPSGLRGSGVGCRVTRVRVGKPNGSTSPPARATGIWACGRRCLDFPRSRRPPPSIGPLHRRGPRGTDREAHPEQPRPGARRPGRGPPGADRRPHARPGAPPPHALLGDCRVSPEAILKVLVGQGLEISSEALRRTLGHDSPTIPDCRETLGHGSPVVALAQAVGQLRPGPPPLHPGGSSTGSGAPSTASTRCAGPIVNRNTNQAKRWHRWRIPCRPARAASAGSP
jgi:hypothetical protein